MEAGAEMKAMLLGLVASLALFAAAGQTVRAAAPLPGLCRSLTFEDTPFVACTVDLDRYAIRLFLNAPDGQPCGSLEAFAARGPSMAFAMNAGMYLPDSSPQGLYVEDGRTIVPLDTADGGGNFHLKPNGVFAITVDGRALVAETGAFRAGSEIAHATQSGPMLVLGGNLHPAFAENGTSLYVRNGVGVRADGKVVFAISLTEVSFGRFARLFRDALECPDALYLDGFVSALADDDGVEVGGGHRAGPIVAVTKRQ